MTSPNRFPWRTAVKIAWREARLSSARFGFVILAVAVGVGSLAGVRGFSREFRRMLLSQARTLMAADMTVRIFGLPTPEQTAALAALEKRGVRETWITETFTMASSAEVREPLLVSLKAVDPAVYPFYGTVRLEPAASLAQALDAQSVAVSPDLLMRLRTKAGESLRIGGQDFRVAAALAAEPDRMTGSLNVGPRVMMSRAGLDRTGLISLGSRASERFLLRLPDAGPDARPGVQEVRNRLKRVFPEGTIADYRETHPVITRGLDRATTYLSLISLITLIVASLGVATAIQSHLQQRLDTIAIMKCLGARAGQVGRIYIAQTLMLGLAGGLAGMIVGMAIERVFPSLIARYFQVDVAGSLDWLAAIESLGIGLLATVLFTLPPLAGIRLIRPASILRREMAEARPGWRERWRNVRPAAVAGVFVLAGIAAIAIALAGATPRDALRMGVYFVAALLASLGLMAAVAWLLLAGVRLFLQRSPWKLPSTLRHGAANLYRPGNHAAAVLIALGIGVMFTLTAYLLERSLVTQIRSSAPPGMPNVFLLDIPGRQRQAFADLVARQPGIQSKPEIFGAVSLKLATVDGVPVEKMHLEGFGRRFLRTGPVTWMADKPSDIDLQQGVWWQGREPQVCVEQEAARLLGAKPGSQLTWTAAGRTVGARVVCVEKTESLRLGARFEFLFNPGTLDGLPAIYYGSLRAKASAVPALQRVSYEAFPTVTVINVADVLDILQQVVDQIARVIQFLSAFAVLAGAIILASAVAGTRFRRVREVVILKTLGATRRRVAGIFSTEFLVLGTVAGIMGSLLASVFAAVVLKRLMQVEYRFDWGPNLIAIAATAVVANVAGWLASWRILGQKPLEVLRDE
jgi:putative ABC transport system permease protein